MLFHVLMTASDDDKRRAIEAHPRYLPMVGIFLYGNSFPEVAHELFTLICPAFRAIKLGDAAYVESSSEIGLIKDIITVIQKQGMVNQSTPDLLHLVSDSEIKHSLTAGQLALLNHTPTHQAKKRKINPVQLDLLVQAMRDDKIIEWGTAEAVWVSLDTATAGQLRALEKLLASKLPSKLADNADPLSTLAYAIEEVAKNVNDEVTDRQKALQHLLATICTIACKIIPSHTGTIASLGKSFLPAIQAVARSGEADVLTGVKVVLDALEQDADAVGEVLAGQWVEILAQAAQARTIPAACTILRLVNVAARKVADWGDELELIAEHHGEQSRKLGSIFRASELTVLHWLRRKDTKTYPVAVTTPSTTSGYLGIDFHGFYLDKLDTANVIHFKCIDKIYPSNTGSAAVVHMTFRKVIHVVEISEDYQKLADRWEGVEDAASPSKSDFEPPSPSPRSRSQSTPAANEEPLALVRRTPRPRVNTPKPASRKGSPLRQETPAVSSDVEPEDLEDDAMDVVIPDGFEPPVGSVKLIDCPCVRTSHVARVLQDIANRGDWKRDLQPFLHGTLFLPPLKIYRSATILQTTAKDFKDAWEGDEAYLKDSRSQPAVQVALWLWAARVAEGITAVWAATPKDSQQRELLRSYKTEADKVAKRFKSRVVALKDD